jgi:hypothetical protein
MTKMQLTYRLSRALGDDDLAQISRLHAVYGIFQARVRPTLHELFVEYDATRFSTNDVKAVLERHGIPLATN